MFKTFGWGSGSSGGGGTSSGGKQAQSQSQSPPQRSPPSAPPPTPPQQAPASEQQPPQPQQEKGLRERMFSAESEKTLNRLSDLGNAVSRWEAEVSSLREALEASAGDPVVAKNRLAIMAGEIENFQARRIDGVDVGGLVSGQAQARSERKELNRRADALHESVVGLHQTCVDRIAAAASASASASASAAAAPGPPTS